MSRLRLLPAIALTLIVLGAAPAVAQEDPPAENAPAVVVEAEPEAVEEDAWTFRFLVPTLILGTGVAVLGVVVGYGLRVRGRYRVTQ